MAKDQLGVVLERHKKWLDGQPDGERADLSEADLRGADLSGADLRGADLRRADIDYACWPLWCGSKGA